MSHAITASPTEPWTLFYISWFLIKIPAPIDDPITKLTAETKPMLFFLETTCTIEGLKSFKELICGLFLFT
jgi:hypothetical protein